MIGYAFEIFNGNDLASIIVFRISMTSICTVL